MLILHISDIHFKSPECLDPAQDPDLPIRTRMMRDLTKQVDSLGKIDAILIGGDVAFKAAKEEYETAWNWIQQIATLSGCPKERIFVVPGNHDIDRAVIKKSMPIQSAQHMIASAPLSQREWRLSQQLADEDSGQSLLKSHSAYNEFAAPLGCQIWPDKPFWHQDVQLDHGVTLRIYGLTSTLLSGSDGADDAPGSLYVSPKQTVLNPLPNTANLVLMHHPIEWLSDADAVDDALTTRASFHLFGHKHRQRAVITDTYVRIGAGAVNPSRSEHSYQPGYNLIQLKVAGEGSERHLDVELHQRRLQDAPEIFVSILNNQGGHVFRTKILVPVEVSFPAIDKILGSEISSNVSKAEVVPPDAEGAMGNADTRDLLYRFWQLTSSQRRRIAQDLDLLKDDEMKLPEPERYGRALIRAGERDVISKVAAAVAKWEKRV